MVEKDYINWINSMANDDPDELMHYGRQGMKWGQHIFGKIKTAKTNRKRKKNLERARAAKVAKQKAAVERKKLLDSGKLSAKQMTDDELSAQIRRLENEKRYKELVRDTTTISKGKKYASDFAKGPGKKIFVDTTVDLAAQTFKAVEADKINKFMRQYGFDGEIVFTNNKRK